MHSNVIDESNIEEKEKLSATNKELTATIDEMECYINALKMENEDLKKKLKSISTKVKHNRKMIGVCAGVYLKMK